MRSLMLALIVAMQVLISGNEIAGAQQSSAAAASTQAAAVPEFDVAAIHRHIPEPHEHNSIWSEPNDSHFKAANMSLMGLISWASEIPESRIINAPGWVGSTYFNIDASSDASVNVQMKDMPLYDARSQKKRMVQELLTERFKLVTHTETRELPIYELVAAKGSPKLGDAKSSGTTINHWTDHLEVQGGDSLTLLAEELAKEVGRPVIDKTGIAGRYDLKLRWTPDTGAPASANPSADAPPSIFTALEEQLGLKLKSAKGPVEVLVVDHAEMPTEN